MRTGTVVPHLFAFLVESRVAMLHDRGIVQILTPRDLDFAASFDNWHALCCVSCIHPAAGGDSVISQSSCVGA